MQIIGLTRVRLAGLAPTLRQARPLTLARTIATSSARTAAPVPASTTQQRSPALVNPSVTPVQANDAFALAKAGSNQLSLETPRNGVEYALGTMDKIVNWARQGSMWPMVRLLPGFGMSFGIPATFPLLREVDSTDR